MLLVDSPRARATARASDSARTPKSAQRLGSEPSPTSFTTENYQRRVHKSVGGERVGREPDRSG